MISLLDSSSPQTIIGMMAGGLSQPGGGSVPVNTAPPTIVGVLQVGQVWVATPGTWTGSPSLSYQWYRDATPISGATALTYGLTTDDIGHNLIVRETDSVSGTSADSTGTGIVPNNDTSLSALTAAGNAVDMGTLLMVLGNGTTDAVVIATATDGAASISIALQAAANPASYDVPGLQAGDNLVAIVVTAADTLTSQTYNLDLHVLLPSPNFTVVNLTSTGDPANPTVGDTLTATALVDPAATVTYQWLAQGVAIPGATGQTYTADRAVAMGNELSCACVATDEGGTCGPVSSGAISLCTGPPLCTDDPIVTTDGAGGGTPPGGPAVALDTLSCDGGTWTGYPDPTPFLAYEWADSVGLEGATGPTYGVVSGNEFQSPWSCQVTGNTGIGPPVVASSNAMTVNP